MRLNKTQKYAILYLLGQNKTSVDISKELGIDKTDVEKMIEKNQKSVETSPVPVVSAKTTSKDLMIRHTRDKGTNSVAIMTKEASAANDEAKKNFPQHNDSTGIYRPRP